MGAVFAEVRVNEADDLVEEGVPMHMHVVS